MWLNYSYIPSETGKEARVTAEINNSIAGIDLKLTVATAAALGGGTVGTPATELILTNVAQNVITGIGASYTGNGVNNGHNLTINDYSVLIASTPSVTVNIQ